MSFNGALSSVQQYDWLLGVKGRMLLQSLLLQTSPIEVCPPVAKLSQNIEVPLVYIQNWRCWLCSTIRHINPHYRTLLLAGRVSTPAWRLLSLPCKQGETCKQSNLATKTLPVPRSHDITVTGVFKYLHLGHCFLCIYLQLPKNVCMWKFGQNKQEKPQPQMCVKRVFQTHFPWEVLYLSIRGKRGRRKKNPL